VAGRLPAPAGVDHAQIRDVSSRRGVRDVDEPCLPARAAAVTGSRAAGAGSWLSTTGPTEGCGLRIRGWHSTQGRGHAEHFDVLGGRPVGAGRGRLPDQCREAGCGAAKDAVLKALFSEEPGCLIQIRRARRSMVMDALRAAGLRFLQPRNRSAAERAGDTIEAWFRRQAGSCATA